MRRLALLVSMGFALALAVPATALAGGQPEYEQAYFNGTTVTINAIEVHQNPNVLTHATADFYQVVYPTDHSLWPAPPQCDPCDHQGNGVDFTDFHDHVLDSEPGTGHSEFSPLWHVFLIVPVSLDEAAQLRTRLDAATSADENTRSYVERLEAMVDEERLPAGDDLIS